MEEKKRNYGFKNTKGSKTGEIQIHINKDLTSRVKNYGHSVGMNCCQITNLALKEYLDKKERELYESMSKEDLVNMILNIK